MLVRFLEKNQSNPIWRNFDELNTAITRSFLDQDSVRSTQFPQINVYNKEDESYVQAFLPGVKLADLDLTSKENILTIKGTRRAEELAEGTKVHFQEMVYGEFARSLQFPFLIDGEKISAQFKDGVLGILVPRREDDKPKKIKIQSSQNKD